MYINLIRAQYSAAVRGNIWHFDEPLGTHGEALVVHSSPHRLIKLSAGHIKVLHLINV